MGRDVVFGLEPGEFADDLRGAERLAGVGRKTVAGDVVLDAGDVAAERCVAILEGETGGQAFEDFDVAAERGVGRIGAEAAVVVKLVGFIAFARDVCPEVDAGVHRLIERGAVGNRLRHDEVGATGHGLNAGGGDGAETGFRVEGRDDRIGLVAGAEGARDERIVRDNFNGGVLINSVDRQVRSQLEGAFRSIHDAERGGGAHSKLAVNGRTGADTCLVDDEHAACIHLDAGKTRQITCGSPVFKAAVNQNAGVLQDIGAERLADIEGGRDTVFTPALAEPVEGVDRLGLRAAESQRRVLTHNDATRED